MYELKLGIECVVTVGFVLCRRLEACESASRVTNSKQNCCGLGVEEYFSGGIPNIEAVYLFEFHTERASGLWTVDLQRLDLGVNQNF